MVFTKVWWVAANNQHGMGLTYSQNNYIISQIYVDSLNVWEMVSVFNIFSVPNKGNILRQNI